MGKSKNSINLKKNYPIKVSCLGSVYIKSSIEEISLSLNSLFSSKYYPDEIVVVIDGEVKKEVLNFLKLFKSKTKTSFKLIYNSQNLGTGLAMRKGLEKCLNDIIVRFDSDDIALPDRLKYTFEFMQNNPNIDIVSSPLIEFIHSINNDEVNAYYRSIPLGEKISKIVNFRNPINHPSVAFRKNSILAIGSYEDVKYFEDYFLWIKAVKNNLKFKNLTEPTVLMKRQTLSTRRSGILFCLYDIKFVLKVFQQGYLKPIFHISSSIRIILKVFSFLYSILARLIFWRSKKFKLKNPYIYPVEFFNRKYIKKVIQSI